MNQFRLIENGQGVKELRGENLDELSAQPAERILLDQLVQVRREQLEDKTQVTLVDKGVP